MVRRLVTFTAIALLVAPAAGSARERLPVPWTVDAAIRAQSEAPNSPPAGSNDWGCEPTRRHRNPVVLVHGLAANRTVNWSTMSPLLANEGYCVFALTYGQRDNSDLGFYQPGGFTRMERSARELKRFVERVLRATGARRVDIVGHSQGSLMPNYYVRFMGGADLVDDYVGVTPLWDGTNAAGLATIDQIGSALGLSGPIHEEIERYCASCPQFLQGSAFMRKMNRGGGPAAKGVDYTMIMTRNDELVIPYTSGIMEGARNRVVQDRCALDQSEHLSIIFDPVTAGLITNALDPRHREPVPCTAVLPLVGATGYGG